MFGRGKSKSGKLPKIGTVIGSGTEVTGDIRFVGGMHIDGKVLGSVSAENGADNTLVLSELGRIEGDVRVPAVVLNGEVHGDVHAERVELAHKASIHGTVFYKYLEMMIGAVVNGQLVRMDEDPRASTGQALSTGPAASGLMSGRMQRDERSPAANASDQGVESRKK